jgi:hypothetical protein
MPKPKKTQVQETEMTVLLRIEQTVARMAVMLALSAPSERARVGGLRQLGMDWKQIGSLLGDKADAVRMRFTRDVEKTDP